MNLLILGGKRSGYIEENIAYRGTYRAHPYYCEQFGDNHKVNQAFFWFVKEGGEIGVVRDLARAYNLVGVYKRFIPNQEFEIVEVTIGRNAPVVGTKFYGFDLSCGFNYSLLVGGIGISTVDKNLLLHDKVLHSIYPLLCLTKQFFEPKLNSNGLFDDYNLAKFYLDCMMALQKIRPGLLENEEQSDFEVAGLYKVCVSPDGKTLENLNP